MIEKDPSVGRQRRQFDLGPAEIDADAIVGHARCLLLWKRLPQFAQQPGGHTCQAARGSVWPSVARGAARPAAGPARRPGSRRPDRKDRRARRPAARQARPPGRDHTAPRRHGGRGDAALARLAVRQHERVGPGEQRAHFGLRHPAVLHRHARAGRAAPPGPRSPARCRRRGARARPGPSRRSARPADRAPCRAAAGRRRAAGACRHARAAAAAAARTQGWQGARKAAAGPASRRDAAPAGGRRHAK